RLGKVGSAEAPLAMTPAAKRSKAGLRTVNESVATFSMESTRVNVVRGGMTNFNNAYTNYFRNLYRVLDKDKKGFITKKDMVPRQFQVTVSQGSNLSRGLQPPQPFIRGGLRVGLPPSTRGPVWFRKMDRNGDGDVSRKEFLGTDADFRRIDTDGDGLISVEEA